MVSKRTGASLDAEYSVIGCLLIDPSIAGELFAVCRETDFTRPELQTLYAAARQLFFEGRPVDAVTIRASAGKEYEPLMMECMSVTPSAAGWRAYVDTAQEQTRLYRMRELGAMLQDAGTSEQARELIDKAAKVLTPQADDRISTASELVAAFFAGQAEEVEFINSGIGKLDKRVYTEMGDMIILAGRPSSGKTALALQMASAIGKKHRVGFFSLETSAKKIADRWVSNQCMINFGDIKRRTMSPSDMECAVQHKGALCALNFEVVKAAGMSVQDILQISRMRRYDVIFIDYLQLVRGRGKDRFEQVTSVSVDLHTMAQDNGITVYALSQLSRGGAGDAPQLTDLRESGQIEQDADAVFFLYLADADKKDSDRILRVAKNKEGGLGEIQLVFDGAKQTFIEYMEEPQKHTKIPHYKREKQNDPPEQQAIHAV